MTGRSREAWTRLRPHLSSTRSYAEVVARSPWNRGRVCTTATDLVVEGHPRSGNSAIVASLNVLADGPLHVASHLHAIGHVRRAIALGLPTVVAIREPIETVASQRIRHEAASPSALLQSWIVFHRHLAELVDEDAPLSLVDNQWFREHGMEWAEQRLSQLGIPRRSMTRPDHDLALAEDLRRQTRDWEGESEVDPLLTSAPSAERTDAAAAARAEFEVAELASARDEAARLHQELQARASR